MLALQTQEVLAQYDFYLNIFSFNYERPFVRINCYNNADWPNENKDEIDKAIKECIKVIFVF